MNEPENMNQSSSPTSWAELFYKLITTKRGLILIGIAIAVILLSIFIFRPNQVNFQTNAGTITFFKGNTQTATVTVSASGDPAKKKSPWTVTNIWVKKGDKVKIQASGSVHTALKKLIAIAQTDRQLFPSWVSPVGSSSTEESDWDSRPIRELRKLMPDSITAHNGYGKLIAAIWEERKGVSHKRAVGASPEEEWEIEQEGKLAFAVNDILLDANARNAYALPIHNNYLYYKTQIEQEERLKEQNGEPVSNESLKVKIDKAYKRRTDTWDQDILPKSNFTVWYQDNVGAFSVSVTVN